MCSSNRLCTSAAKAVIIRGTYGAAEAAPFYEPIRYFRDG